MINLQQKLSQQLKLLPQQIQYQKLLQLNNLALEMRINEELDLNPVLEEIILESPEPDKLPDDENSGVEELENQELEKIDNEFSVEDYFPSDIDAYKTNEESNDNRGELFAPYFETLKEHLYNQLNLLDIAPELKLLGREIIGNLGNDGYLRVELNEILKDLELFSNIKISYEDAEKVLNEIQHFDPIGIASRSLQECLLIQIKARDLNPELKDIIIKILTNTFDDFLNKKFELIEQKLEITQNQLKEALQEIQHLDPKPGEGNFYPEEFNQITPDLIVEKINNRFHVYLNDRFIKPLRINEQYLQMLSKIKRKAKSADEKQMKQFLKEKIDDAKWLIDSIDLRKRTLLRIMNAIVEAQKEFFESGEDYLKPMVYKDIAERTGYDISTISRVVNGKYVQSPVGIYELKYFFSEGLKTAGGERISNKKIKSMLIEIIRSEDKSKPLSDDNITEIFNNQGIDIKRRTVAKYRELLGIPIAKLRKNL